MGVAVLPALPSQASVWQGRHVVAPASAWALGPVRMQASPTTVSGLALPMLSDGMNMDSAQYYETIQSRRRSGHHTVQSADIDGDGQDELVYRGPAGMSAFRFDDESGQWFSLPPGPAWSDAAGWGEARYYTTIQLADVNGDGRAELIGRGPRGVEVFGYDPDLAAWFDLDVANPMPEAGWEFDFYFETIQCADIDGDGQAELLGRYVDGLRAWKLNGESWVQLSTLGALSDIAGWIVANRFPTIQCADVDGDGRAEVLGLDSSGLHVWRFDGSWSEPYPVLTGLSDAWPLWPLPPYFLSVQTADLDGDGKAEVIARNDTQILAWGLDPTGWTPMAPGPMMPDQDGWILPQYCLTLQTADLDGDGKDELIVRNSQGIQAWSYTNGAWLALAMGPEWSDAKGWNTVEYYSTIQTARVKSPGGTNDHMPATKTGRVDLLLGRASTAIETYRFRPDDSWSPTSAPWPVLDPAAYEYAAILLGVPGQQIRDLYTDDVTDVLIPWESTLSAKPAPPAGYNGSLEDWDKTIAQLALEVGWAVKVQNWWGQVGDLITTIYTGEGMTLTAVGDIIGLKSPDDTQTILDVLAFLASVGSALTAGADAVCGAIAGVAAAAFTLAEGSGSTPESGTLAELTVDLDNAFAGAILTSAEQLTTVVTEYGLLSAIGRQIAAAAPAWTWKADTAAKMAISGQRGYAIGAWQSLVLPAEWRWSVNFDSDAWNRDDNRGDYLINRWYWDESNVLDMCRVYFVAQHDVVVGTSEPTLVDPAVLSQLFGPAQESAVMPLGVSPRDVVTALNGWPVLQGAFVDKIYSSCSSVPAPNDLEVSAGSVAPALAASAALAAKQSATAAPKKTSTRKPPEKFRPSAPRPTGVDLRARARLTRDDSGDVVARITVVNHGLTAADDLVFTSAALGGRDPLTGVPVRARRVDDGEAVTRHFRFSGVPGKSGKPVTLTVRVAYDGGSRTEKLQLTMP